MQQVSEPPPSSVHVLFVHGVGQHTRLSSLMQAYQAVRSNLRSPEVPSAVEDPIAGWKVVDFNDSASPPYLKLANRVPGRSPAELYFYEINYSQLAGVVRANHRIDVTRLFVGFDLAVNWSRTRLLQDAGRPAPIDSRDIAMAKILQRLSGVFAGVTVPVLGLPSLLLRNYTRTFVGTFRRFFEDIATFSMDRNGQQLISEHMKRTVEDIFAGKAFNHKINAGDGDNLFVIAAHSLGTVVAHNYLVGQWREKAPRVPSEFLTFGSPIGLVCWMWLFLDFPRMHYVPDSEAPVGGKSDAEKEELLSKYFCWSAESAPAAAPKPFRWINVINHLDPIATAFPLKHVDLSMQEPAIANALKGREIQHRYIRTGGLGSVGAAHTEYFDDRRENDSFIELLVQVVRLRPGDPARLLTERGPDLNWREMALDLLRLRILAALCGIGAILLYAGLLVWKFGPPQGRILLPGYVWALLPYCWPVLTVGALAFGQRFIYGGPTKRTSESRIDQLRWSDLSAIPYLLRRCLVRGAPQGDAVKQARDARIAPGPDLFTRLCTFVFEFVPTLIGMLAPVAYVKWMSDKGWNPFPAIWEAPSFFGGLALVFIFYLMCFSLSEFFACWRAAILVAYPEVPGRKAASP